MHKKYKRIAFIILGIIVLIVLVTCVQIYLLRKDGHPGWRPSLNPKRHRPATLQDIGHIAPWMTFDYLNKVFNLPDTLLKNTLSIDEARYPFITIKQYTAKININQQDFIQTLQTIITRYITSSSSNELPK